MTCYDFIIKGSQARSRRRKVKCLSSVLHLRLMLHQKGFTWDWIGWDGKVLTLHCTILQPKKWKGAIARDVSPVACFKFELMFVNIVWWLWYSDSTVKNSHNLSMLQVELVINESFHNPFAEKALKMRVSKYKRPSFWNILPFIAEPHHQERADNWYLYLYSYLYSYLCLYLY